MGPGLDPPIHKYNDPTADVDRLQGTSGNTEASEGERVAVVLVRDEADGSRLGGGVKQVGYEERVFRGWERSGKAGRPGTSA